MRAVKGCRSSDTSNAKGTLMAKSTRRPQQVFSIVMWILSLIFAGFLIGLGNLIMDDIPRIDPIITVDDFADAETLQRLERRQETLQAELTPLRRTVEDAQQTEAAARADYRTARQNFDNWIATRNATEAQSTNPEVLRRTEELETLTDRIRITEQRADATEADLRQSERAMTDVRRDLATLRDDARPAWEEALKYQELRVFGFRLMLVLPLLLMAGWMVAEKRDSAYWPLYRGFIIFALIGFFFELLPYLPNYGGYVYVTVGILTVMVCGYFLIKKMRDYLERKRDEEARSEVERRKSIDYETALKKIAAKTCPGCDRSIVKRDGVNSDYCVHCGIHLQNECPNCETRNLTFHRFCLSCGVPNKEAPDPQAMPEGAVS